MTEMHLGRVESCQPGSRSICIHVWKLTVVDTKRVWAPATVCSSLAAPRRLSASRPAVFRATISACVQREAPRMYVTWRRGRVRRCVKPMTAASKWRAGRCARPSCHR